MLVFSVACLLLSSLFASLSHAANPAPRLVLGSAWMQSQLNLHYQIVPIQADSENVDQTRRPISRAELLFMFESEEFFDINYKNPISFDDAIWVIRTWIGKNPARIISNRALCRLMQLTVNYGRYGNSMQFKEWVLIQQKAISNFDWYLLCWTLSLGVIPPAEIQDLNYHQQHLLFRIVYDAPSKLQVPMVLRCVRLGLDPSRFDSIYQTIVRHGPSGFLILATDDQQMLSDGFARLQQESHGPLGYYTAHQLVTQQLHRNDLLPGIIALAEAIWFLSHKALNFYLDEKLATYLTDWACLNDAMVVVMARFFTPDQDPGRLMSLAKFVALAFPVGQQPLDLKQVKRSFLAAWKTEMSNHMDLYSIICLHVNIPFEAFKSNH